MGFILTFYCTYPEPEEIENSFTFEVNKTKQINLKKKIQKKIQKGPKSCLTASLGMLGLCSWQLVAVGWYLQIAISHCSLFWNNFSKYLKL